MYRCTLSECRHHYHHHLHHQSLHVYDKKKVHRGIYRIEFLTSRSVHSFTQKTDMGYKKTISALIDVVKPVDDVEEGEAEGEYYP